MSILLLNPGAAFFKDPLSPDRDKAQVFRWWAQRGMVHWEGATTGEYGSLTVRDALHRVQALHDMIGNSRADGSVTRFPDEYRKLAEFRDQLIEICKLAQQQGRPDDPRHTKQLSAQIKAARQNRFVVVPGMAAAM